jgi:coproporphyrinogen III oxidase-like Fe-S oxidoreductase
VGVGAVGCLHGAEGAVRWTDHRTPAAWLADVEAGRLPSAGEERLGEREIGNERVLLALRTARGLDAGLLPPAKLPEVEALVAAGLASRRGRRVVLTARGLDVQSAVAERLMS